MKKGISIIVLLCILFLFPCSNAENESGALSSTDNKNVRNAFTFCELYQDRVNRLYYEYGIDCRNEISMT